VCPVKPQIVDGSKTSDEITQLGVFAGCVYRYLQLQINLITKKDNQFCFMKFPSILRFMSIFGQKRQAKKGIAG
jgi:hypothetical protein